MRKVYFFTALSFLLSCQSGYNNKMTLLINEKKMAEDSFNFYKNKMDRYSRESEKLQENPSDSVKLKASVDTFTDAMISMQIFEYQIKSITFSIDSLSKMK